MLLNNIAIPGPTSRFRRTRPIVLGLVLTVLVAGARAEPPMQPPPPPGDPVAVLRDLLKQPPGPNLAVRKARITELLDRMDLEELSRVLLLEEWRPPVSIGLKTEAERRLEDEDLAARDEARGDAAKSFLEKAQERLRASNGDNSQKRATSLLAKAAAADLIGETAGAGRKLDYLASISATGTGSRAGEGGIGYLAKQLSPLTSDLIALTKPDADAPAAAAAEQARLSATRSLGEIQPSDPAQVVEALSARLADHNEALRIAAAESIDHLAQASADDMQRSLGRYPQIESRFIDYARAVWLAVLRQGLAPDQPVEVRRIALHAFGRIAGELLDASVIPETNPTLRNLGDPKLAQELEDEANHKFSRLGEVFAVFEKNADALTAAVQDDDLEVRLSALSILGDLALVRQHLLSLKTGATPVVPATPEPGGPAPSTGKEAKPEAALFLGAMVGLVAADDPPFKESQEKSFSDLDKALTRLTDPVVKRLHAPDAETRRAAMDVLEILGPAALPVADAITGALRDPDRFVRWAAARTLGELAKNETDKEKLTDDQAKAAVVGIADLLRDEDVGVRLAAAVALERFGPRAAPAAPTLTKMLNRSQTDAALNLIPTRETEPELVTGDPTVRIAAFRALEAIDGDETVRALPEAVTALRDHSIPVRQAAADMIGRVGPKVTDDAYRQELIDALGKALADPNGEVRRAASGALLRLLPVKTPK